MGLRFLTRKPSGDPRSQSVVEKHTDSERENNTQEEAMTADSLLTSMGGGDAEASGEVEESLWLPGEQSTKDSSADTAFKVIEDKDGEELVNQKKEDDSQSSDDAFTDIFQQEEEVELSPLAPLIASLPDVSIQELLDLAQQVKELITQGQRNPKRSIQRARSR